MYCAHCGKELDDEAGFCYFCGQPLNPLQGSGGNVQEARQRDTLFREEWQEAPVPSPQEQRAQTLRVALIGALAAVLVMGGIGLFAWQSGLLASLLSGGDTSTSADIDTADKDGNDQKDPANGGGKGREPVVFSDDSGDDTPQEPAVPVGVQGVMDKVPDSAAASTEWNGHAYALFDINADWNVARDMCESFGGHLASISSSDEQRMLEQLLVEGMRNSYWLGGVLDEQGDWIWVDGEPFSYDNWAEKQPDNFVPEDGEGGERVDDGVIHESCLMIYRNENPNNEDTFGTWNDLAVDGTCYGEEFFGLDNIGFVCEWDA